jgi:hypothetical protein
MSNPVRFALLAASMVTLGACGTPSGTATDLGPMKYDGSGTMPCSAGTATYSGACGWRRKANGAAEIWISNIAVKDKPAYRVLNFSQGEFTTLDGTKLQVSRDGDFWLVSVQGKEYYRFPLAVITGG